jgi:glycosyltransferase involved in cell wall biosynthesis
MKLTVFFTYPISLKDWHENGLLQREVVLYKNLIKDNGIRVQFITYGDDSDYDLIGECPEIEVIPIYSYIKEPKNKYIKILQTLIVPWRLKRHIKNTNLLKTNQMYGSWVAVIAKIIYKKPLILRSGYELFSNTIKSNKGIFYKICIFLLSFFSYRLCNRIHVATLPDKVFLVKKFRIKSNKVFIHPNWIDVNTFKPKSKVIKNNRLLFVGRLNSQKNIPLLFNALVGTNLSLDIVGKGELKKELKNLSEKLNIDVNFLGNFPNSVMPKIYNQYKIFILCSNYEGNPKTLLEAMSCGCAVIGTSVNGIKEIIDNETTGLLVKNDVLSLKSAINFLNSNDNIQKEMGINASKYIQNNNSLESALKSEIKSYFEVVK